MDVVTVLNEFSDYGITMSATDDKLVIESKKPITEKQRTLIKEYKRQIIDQIAKEMIHGITLSELKEVAGEDWSDIKHDHKMQEALADAINIRHMREKGEIPPDYIHKAECAGCGPVWLFASGRFQGCPWCFNRSRGLPIPRPTNW